MDALKISDGPIVEARGAINYGFSWLHFYFAKREKNNSCEQCYYITRCRRR
jgi:hypothetical protein